MWKPVRLQGAGAAVSIINANAQPAGKLLEPWRRHINCLFGLTLTGVPSVGTGGAAVPYDPTGTYSCPETGWKYFTTPSTLNVPQIDRLPLEAVVGWDATLNGNLAEQLQEPSLMGAYEGAGITVLAKGVWVPPGVNSWTDGSEPGGFPVDPVSCGVLSRSCQEGARRQHVDANDIPLRQEVIVVGNEWCLRRCTQRCEFPIIAI